MENKTKVNPWIILLVVLFAAAGAPAALFKVPPVMGTIIESLSLTAAQGGMLISVFAVAGVLLSIPAGLIINKTGNWRAGLIALVSIIAGSVIGAVSTSLTPLLASRIVEGIGMTFLALVGPAVVSQAFEPAQRGKAMGLFMTYMSLGQIMMFNVAPLIVKPFGWTGVWWFTAAYAGACLLLWLVFKKQMDNRPQAVSAENAAPAQPVSFSRILRNKSVWLITILFTLFMVSFQGVLGFLPTYLVQERGMELATASALSSVVGIVGIFGSILGGALSDKLKTRKWVMLIAMIICGAAYMLIPSVPTALFIIMIVVLGAFPNSIPPVAFSGVAESVEDAAEVGFAISFITTGQYLGLLISATLFGYILDVSGWNMAFMVCAILSVIGGIFVLLDKKIK